MAVRVLCLSYQKAHDATSAMSFFFSSMENVRRGDTCARHCHSASAHRKGPSVMGRFLVFGP